MAKAMKKSMSKKAPMGTKKMATMPPDNDADDRAPAPGFKRGGMVSKKGK